MQIALLHMVLSCQRGWGRVTDVKLDVESLRALRLVAQRGGFTEAADELGVTQSAISWKIKRLEERAGVPLLKRGQIVEPTPDGHDLLAYADRMLEAHDDAVAHLTRSDLEGVVRLGSNEDLHTGELVEVLARFGRAYPNIRLDVRFQLSGIVVEWVEDGDVDLGLVQIVDGGPDGPEPDDVVLWTDPLLWVCAPDVEFDPSQVVPLVSFGPGCAYLAQVDEACARAGLRTRVALECPGLSGLTAAVEAGLGVAAINSRLVTDAMVEWANAPAAAELPHISHVIRTGSHGDREVLEVLRAELVRALEETS
jgi:DNA-binding transcriptional LysR family regulator